MTAFTAKIDGGAVVVPDDYRRALGLDDGDALLMEIDGEELRIRPVLSAIQRVQERLKPFRDPDRLMSDELIADRRAEVAREEMSDRGESADG